jgi:two-component system cell cycle sensor histidine kinase/response regulator CckA
VDGDLLVRSIRYATERGRAMEALERREEHYRSLIENSLDLIGILNIDGTIRYASPSHERVLGYALDELIGQNALSFVHPDDLPAVRDALTKADGSALLEFRCRHKDGSWRVIESFARNLSHLPGVSGVVANSRDITERRRLEEELHHSQRLDAVGRLAGGIAHDFNNLLMVITGHSQMLLDTMFPGDPARADLEQVVKAAERATDLTHQLLAFSRRQAVRPTLLNLNDLVRDMERMLRRVMGEDIELLTTLGPEPQAVRADPGQVEQVVLNIALNARDAMTGGGKLTLETRGAEITQDSGREHPGLSVGSYAVLLVSDTGSGMDPSVRSRVFEPFFTTKEHGTGLGLSTSYGIIKQTGGDIWVESKPGSGTTFQIYLPVAQQVSEEVAAPQSSPLFQGSETILLVEDEEGVRRVVEAMLKRRGYKVLSSASPAEAIAVADGHQGAIDLLIADMVMPGMSGQKMAERLTATRPHMRVLYVSGYGDPIGARATFAFLQKPFSTEELAVKVREVLRETVQSASS